MLFCLITQHCKNAPVEVITKTIRVTTNQYFYFLTGNVLAIHVHGEEIESDYPYTLPESSEKNTGQGCLKKSIRNFDETT